MNSTYIVLISLILLGFCMYPSDCFKYSRDLTYQTSSNQVAYNCMNYGGTEKFCRYIYTYDSGYCCNETDTETVCTPDSSTNYLCSSRDDNVFPANTNYILTPTNSSACGSSQLLYMNHTGETYNLRTYDQSSNPVCWYRLENFQGIFNSVKVNYTDFSSSGFIVEMINTDQNLTIKSYDSLDNGGPPETFDMERDDIYFILVLTTTVTSSDYVEIRIETTDKDNDDELSTGAIVGIVLGCIVFIVVIVIIIIIVCCCCCCRKSPQHSQNNYIQKEENAIIVINQEQPSQLQIPVIQVSQTEEPKKVKQTQNGTYYVPEPTKPVPEHTQAPQFVPQAPQPAPQPTPQPAPQPSPQPASQPIVQLPGQQINPNLYSQTAAPISYNQPAMVPANYYQPAYAPAYPGYNPNLTATNNPYLNAQPQYQYQYQPNQM